MTKQEYYALVAVVNQATKTIEAFDKKGTLPEDSSIHLPMADFRLLARGAYFCAGVMSEKPHLLEGDGPTPELN